MSQQKPVLEFQSPCGDLESGDPPSMTQFSVAQLVSVPLRGFRVWRLPLKSGMNKQDTSLVFQSPCGDLESGDPGIPRR